MRKKDFDFFLPKNLIAQAPLESRDESRLLCMDRISGVLEHRHFFELPDLLNRGDCLVLNDSRVLPARLLGSREGGGAIEVLLLREQHPKTVRNRRHCEFPAAQIGACDRSNPGKPCKNALSGLLRCTRKYEGQSCRTASLSGETLWECLVRPGRRIKVGTRLIFGTGELTAAVNDVLPNGIRLIEFHCAGIFLETLDKLGKMPLPPYIHEELQNPERYQTIYSRELGSAAAPTAGLHFTQKLLTELEGRGIEICYITLHVGLGTFRPVKADNIEDHIMHSEVFTIPPQTAQQINRAKENGGRVIAVGTTTCRTLESVADDNGKISPTSGSTDIFIYPGYEFKCIDGLITNFHLPESTLIMLVSAFAGRENTLAAYAEAIRREYRFFSLGDAMMVG